MEWHIGCSGFHYKEWKNVFYPDKMPQREWFEHYSRHFDTLELNVTFYRFPKPAFLENWYAKSPAHFSFSAKVPRLITHYKKFKDCDRLLDDFYSTLRNGLQEKLGTVLFQLPPQLVYSDETLETLLNSVDPNFKNVIEFRHASWWEKHVINALADKNISFCGISYPGLPTELIVNTKTAYYRFHGIPRLYHSSYKDAELKKLADAIKKHRSLERIFIYFNNTASTAAIENAIFVKKLTQDKSVSKAKATRL
jgi:uncharacterized protein YecE (DUF72 family)